jgi:hypothetical protein
VRILIAARVLRTGHADRLPKHERGSPAGPAAERRFAPARTMSASAPAARSVALHVLPPHLGAEPACAGLPWDPADHGCGWPPRRSPSSSSPASWEATPRTPVSDLTRRPGRAGRASAPSAVIDAVIDAALDPCEDECA